MNKTLIKPWVFKGSPGLAYFNMTHHYNMFQKETDRMMPAYDSENGCIRETDRLVGRDFEGKMRNQGKCSRK